MIYYLRERKMNKSIKILSSVLVLCAFGIADACAAPSVRLLGTNTAQLSGKSVTPTNTIPSQGATSSARVGTIRPKSVSSVTTSGVNRVIKPSTVSSDESRLSIGKYIHNAGVTSGVIQPAGAAASPSSGATVASSEFISLVDRVSDLEGEIETKQDIFEAGNGLIMENGVIDIESAIYNLPEQVADLQTQIDNKTSAESLVETLSDYYYTKDEISDVLDEEIGSDINTIYDTATGERKYVSIVDTFDDDILD